jgi:hypothetical protein
MRETIWAARGLYWDDPSIVYPTPTQYTRTDVADARITELEAALGEFARFASRKEKSGASVPFGQSKLHAARAALKGEKT